MKLLKFLIIGILVFGCDDMNQSKTPSYLSDYNDQYKSNPREANLEWFKKSKIGLFIHYGLYSQLGRGEWVQLRDTIPVSEYAKLKETFNPSNFDADKITDLAISAGMKYITITSKHHDGFSLFDTKQNDFNSIKSPLGRDLIGELYKSCKEKKIGLFLYYSYAADWSHPYFYSRLDGWSNARPAYKELQTEYKYKNKEDFSNYIKFAHNQLKELLTQYPEIAGIWLDPIMGYYANHEMFPIEETYSLIRSISKHALISFKQGANGDEDFSAPEHNLSKRVGNQYDVARIVYEMNKFKPKEVCTTLQSRYWGYDKNAKHKNFDDIYSYYLDAIENDTNLLLNVGPLPDGSIHYEDVIALTKLGEKIKSPINK